MMILIPVDKASRRSPDTVHNPHRPPLYISRTSSYDETGLMQVFAIQSLQMNILQAEPLTI